MTIKKHRTLIELASDYPPLRGEAPYFDVAIDKMTQMAISDLTLGGTVSNLTATQIAQIQKRQNELINRMMNQAFGGPPPNPFHGTKYHCVDCQLFYVVWNDDPPRSLTTTHCQTCERNQKEAGGLIPCRDTTRTG